LRRKNRADRETKGGGLYHLLFHLPRRIRIRVGALGLQVFPHGYYIYTGSAKRGLAHRIARHLRKRKKRHWQIDFLTTVARVERILINDSGFSTECQRHQAISDLPQAKVMVAWFGSSDCRCRSHLAYFRKRPRLQDNSGSGQSLVVVSQKHPPKILIPSSGRVKKSFMLFGADALKPSKTVGFKSAPSLKKSL